MELEASQTPPHNTYTQVALWSSALLCRWVEDHSTTVWWFWLPLLSMMSSLLTTITFLFPSQGFISTIIRHRTLVNFLGEDSTFAWCHIHRAPMVIVLDAFGSGLDLDKLWHSSLPKGHFVTLLLHLFSWFLLKANFLRKIVNVEVRCQAVHPVTQSPLSSDSVATIFIHILGEEKHFRFKFDLFIVLSLSLIIIS